MSNRLPIIILIASASLAAKQPPDPVYVLWDIETPLLWTCCVSDHGQEIIVTSTTVPQATDPVWWDVQAWAQENQVPRVSPMAGCFVQCKDICSPGTVKRVKFVAAGPNGKPPASCECECWPVQPTTNPPPPNGSAD